MIYITIKQQPVYHQMSINDLLFKPNDFSCLVTNNTSNTRTYTCTTPSEKLLNGVNVEELIKILSDFNESTRRLREVPRESLYHSFHIPKKSGGLRRIDAPNDDLMNALRVLKNIFESKFHASYHTSAFAYVKERSTIDAIKRHQLNSSRWFGKFDLSNFFGSTTIDFVMRQLSMIFPFSEVMKIEEGEFNVRTALELSFLNGGLPQGTPISPTLTNLMMIPLDHAISKGVNDIGKNYFVYTRYADDFIISSKYTFDIRKVEDFISGVLNRFNAPFSLNESKTRYGSSSGSNWNLGVMLNKENNITIGSKKKKRFQAMIYNYIKDKSNGIHWDKHDVQVLDGHYNYYKMVEGESIDRIVNHIGKKVQMNVLQSIKDDLKI